MAGALTGGRCGKAEGLDARLAGGLRGCLGTCAGAWLRGCVPGEVQVWGRGGEVGGDLGWAGAAADYRKQQRS